MVVEYLLDDNDTGGLVFETGRQEDSKSGAPVETEVHQ